MIKYVERTKGIYHSVKDHSTTLLNQKQGPTNHIILQDVSSTRYICTSRDIVRYSTFFEISKSWAELQKTSYDVRTVTKKRISIQENIEDNLDVIEKSFIK